ncbi:MAG: nitroreductase family protein [Gemmobacter sp.]
MTDAFAFLSARRSHPAKTLTAPVPDRAALTVILAAALRVPDHGKLEPWRLIVLERAALSRLADLVTTLGIGADAEAVAKARAPFDGSSLAVVVVASPKDSPKIPVMEQTLSTGALCVGIVNAAHAAGWGACWLTGAAAYDRTFMDRGLGLAAREWVAGIVHIGTIGPVPPDRPRPDPARAVTWVSA